MIPPDRRRNRSFLDRTLGAAWRFIYRGVMAYPAALRHKKRVKNKFTEPPILIQNVRDGARYEEVN